MHTGAAWKGPRARVVLQVHWQYLIILGVLSFGDWGHKSTASGQSESGSGVCGIIALSGAFFLLSFMTYWVLCVCPLPSVECLLVL